MGLNELNETLKRKVLLRRNRRVDPTTFWMSRYWVGAKRLCPISLPPLVPGTVREENDGHHVHSWQSEEKQISDQLSPKTGEKGKDFSLKDFIQQRSETKLFLTYSN